MIYSNYKTTLSLLMTVLVFFLPKPLLAELNGVETKTAQEQVIDLTIIPNGQELTGLMRAIIKDSSVQTLNDAQNFNNWVNATPDKLAAPRQLTTSWLKATFHNSSDLPLIHWLVLEPWRLNRVDAYFVNPDTGEQLWHTATGLEVPLQNRAISNGKTIIPIKLNAGEARQIFVKINSKSLPSFSIKNWEPVAYTENIDRSRLFQTAILAGILTLLIVLVSQLNTGLLITGAWLLAAFILEAEKDGYFSNYLLSSLEHYSFNLRVSAALFAGQLFLATSVFLLGLNRQKTWRRLLLLTAFLAFLIAGLTFILDPTTIRYLGIVLTLFYTLSWLFMIAPALRIRQPGQITLFSLLAIDWATNSFILLGYIFNFYYTSAFVEARIYIELLIALTLITTYTWQQKSQLKASENALKEIELKHLETLEETVESRTQDLNNALTSAHKASTAKVNFLGQISHDLRSPLTSILGYAQLQAVQAVDQRKANQIIQDNAFYMRDLIDGLVSYARDSATHSDEQRDIYLITFTDNLVNQAHLLAQKQGNRFQFKIETDLPTVIRCKSTQLQRVLMNLLDNAAKYTSNGRITLSIAVSTHQDKNCLIFSITDTGKGISKEQLEQVFTPYYQATKNGTGAGLGLAISQELTESMGGTLDIKSELGVGTQITCTIPYTPVDEQQVNPCMPAIDDLLPSYNAQGQLAWLVEDSQPIGQLLSRELTEMGFTPLLFTSAEAFIEALHKGTEKPAIIITDYRLPGASGAKVLSMTRSYWPNLPVVLLSGTQNSNPQPFNIASQRFSAYLSKPVNLLELRLKLAELCNLKPEA